MMRFITTLRRLFAIAAFAMIGTTGIAAAQGLGDDPFEGQCPPGAWCHPGGIPTAFISNDDADAVGDALTNYECTFPNYRGCLGKLLSALNCLGPKGPIREELCNSAGGGDEDDAEAQSAQTTTTASGFVVTAYRNAAHKKALFAYLDGNKYSEDEGVVCDEKGRCYCPVDQKFRHPNKVKGDFVMTCSVKETQYVIVGQGDDILMSLAGKPSK